MKKAFAILLPLGCLLVLSSTARAGALYTKSKQAEIGTVVESESSVSLQSQFGAVDYKKENLVWYSIDPAIDTFFKAAQKAKEANNDEAAIALFNVSAAREPATQVQAQSESQVLQLATATVPATAASTPEPDPKTPEEKIKRGEILIERAKALQTLTTLDKSVAKENRELGDKEMKEGKKLIEEGQRELEALKKQQAVEQAVAQQVVEQQKEEEKKAEIVKQERKEIQKPIEWTDEERYVNLGTAGLLILAVLGSLWQITIREPKK